MSKNIRNVMMSCLFMFGLIALPLATSTVTSAVGNKQAVCEGVNGIQAAGAEQCAPGGTGSGALGTFITNIINILLFVIGAIAVIMIIIGGIRYITSNGDSAQTTGAKNTILYAVVGVVVALMAFAIVNFVVKNI